MTVSKIILLSAALLSGLHLFAQDWLPLGEGTDNFRIWTLYEDTASDILYIGGDFGKVEGRNQRGIAAWNGNDWSQLQNSINFEGETICRWNGNIYVGGSSKEINGDSINGIAKISNGQYEDLDYGLSDRGAIYKLIPTDSFLYAFGVFDSIGGIAADGMARWDGEHWGAFAPSVIETPEPNNNYIIYDAAFYKGKLIVAGNFNDDSGRNLNEIAQWDGQEWTSLDQSIIGDGIIFDLQVYQDELYAGGWFANPADPNELSIARWDGTQWKRVGGGLSQSAIQIQNMHVWDDKLWVTSGPGQAGGLTDTATIHYWDGTDWCQLKTVDHYGFALGSYRDTLITGTTRYADSVYGEQINFIAKMNMADYTDTCSNIAVGVKEGASSLQSLSVYPNPASDYLFVDGLANATRYRLFELTGQLVQTGTFQNDEAIELNHLSSGIYLLRIEAEQPQTFRIVKQ